MDTAPAWWDWVFLLPPLRPRRHRLKNLVGTRFAVFAEAGLAYTSQTAATPTSFGDNERTTWTFGTRTVGGATLYF